MVVVCPICKTSAEGEPSKDGSWCKCPNCGSYEISRTAYGCCERLNEKARTVLSHAIWMHQGEDKPFRIDSAHLDEAEKGSLPGPAEQLDLYILFIGDSQGDSPGKTVSCEDANLRAKIGAILTDDVTFINKEAADKGLLESMATLKTSGGWLTLDGWEHYRKLKRGRTQSRTAFVALPFKNAEVVRMVDEVFRPAVKETGFDLKRLDDAPPAGLIDNRLRVEIRMCRFLIADLTDANNGAYWEAGYAEGLEKPVIYTCSKAYFEKNKTHFDTNHQHTLLWDVEEPQKAAEALTATIRATLPFDAKMPKD